MKYNVWLATTDGAHRVSVLDSDQAEEVNALVGALVTTTGNLSYDVGVSINGAGPMPATGPQEEKKEEAPPPPGPTPPAHHAGAKPATTHATGRR